MGEDAELLRDTLRSFRSKEVEPVWEALDAHDTGRFAPLWQTLRELGVTDFGLPESLDGTPLDAESRRLLLSGLGASSPALGAALIGHVTAQTLIAEASAAVAPDATLRAQLGEGRYALAGSPLDALPHTPFVWHGAASPTVSGRARLAWPAPDFVVLPVAHDDALKLCVLPAQQPGLSVSVVPSSHGLCLLPFGELVLDACAVSPDRVFDWPTSGLAARQADGLLVSLLAGITDELCERAMGYALERYQGGKMIHEHDAVRQLVGPIELSRRVLDMLAEGTLGAAGPGDGGAAAFAVALVRKSGLDAIQTFGGYGYMEDYRVERYLRDANTLETLWIHADLRQRQIAETRFAQMAR